MTKNKKVCLISSAGGHLDELKQLKEVTERYECFYVVTRTKMTEHMQEKRYIVHNLLRKNKLILLSSFLRMTVEQAKIFFLEKPDIIITTGAGVAIPMCLIGKLLGKQIIYIESYARVTTPNKTGVLLYKFADVFIIQWEELREYYPNAVYGGGIF